MSIVEIINLTKSFRDTEVIHNTSFYGHLDAYKNLKLIANIRA